MRRITMFNHVSADGFFSAPDGNLDWVVQDEEINQQATEGMPGADTILFGRRTYEMFAAFWPHVLDDPGANLHGHARTPAIRAMAVWLNETPKLVFSRTLKDAGWRGTRVLQELDPREIEALKSQPGKGIIIFGSGSIVSQLTEHGLIDEYQLVVGPILLGSGRPLFRELPGSVRLELIEARPHASGNVTLRYARAS